MSTSHQRAERLYEAAQLLFVRYGYDKTTVSEIAQEAGVSKGAVYLHHASKEALFEALLGRALTSYTAHWLRLVEQDPRGGTIGGLYRNVQKALNDNPLMSALFRQDRRFFGSYLKQPDNMFRKQRPSTKQEFVQLMQDAGAIRSDIDAPVVAHVMNILAYGLVSMDEVMSSEEIPELDDLLEGIGEILDRALTPPDFEMANEVGKRIVSQLVAQAAQDLVDDSQGEGDDQGQ